MNEETEPAITLEMLQERQARITEALDACLRNLHTCPDCGEHREFVLYDCPDCSHKGAACRYGRQGRSVAESGVK